MNEDEAFIRAIVDAPGDDTRRLVYAGWLQENGHDQRAAYIRAEAAWARTGKKVKALQKLGVALDPVWVYRVSRPPLGVCLAKEIFSERGRVLTHQEANGASSWPPEYRAFLLNYNGGILIDALRDETYQSDYEISAFASFGERGREERVLSEGSVLTIKELKSELVHPNGSDLVLTSRFQNSC